MDIHLVQLNSSYEWNTKNHSTAAICIQVRFADTAAEEKKKKYRVCFDCCDARRRPFPTHVRVTTGRLDWTGPYCILFVYSISPSAMNNDRERDADICRVIPVTYLATSYPPVNGVRPVWLCVVHTRYTNL